jgi:hypothetical protein
MNNSDAFATFLFLCIFEILGGGAIGVFVRSLRRREGGGIGFFFLIWGGGFAGIPLIIGGAELLTSDRPSLFVAQLFVFVMAIALVALMPSEIFDKDTNANFPSVIVGAVLAMFGASILLLTLQEGVGIGALIGAALALGGIAILFRSVLGVLRAP